MVLHAALVGGKEASRGIIMANYRPLQGREGRRKAACCKVAEWVVLRRTGVNKDGGYIHTHIIRTLPTMRHTAHRTVLCRRLPHEYDIIGTSQITVPAV